ncbi:MAG: hypothetical protein ABGY75_11780, partial [Gemmataceae bacterium]
MSVFLVVPLAAALVSLLYPGGLVAAFEDARDADRLDHQLKSCHERDAELEGSRTLSFERASQKEQLAMEWIHGRVRFGDVVRRFEELNRGAEHVFRTQRRLYGENLSEGELSGLNAVSYVTAKLRGMSSADYHLGRLNA